MLSMRRLEAAFAAALAVNDLFEASNLRLAIVERLPRDRPRRPHARCTGKSYRANGQRERSRRLVQIAAGRLRAENGVVARVANTGALAA